MLPRFSIRIFSQTVHNADVANLAQALYDRLPETDLFFVFQSWLDEKSPREFISIFDTYVDLFICVGTPSFWGEMIGLEDLERWASMGKAVLWLHLPPPQNADETSPSLCGMEVLPREVWVRMEPVIEQIRALADETRIERKFRERQKYRGDSNPFGDPSARHDASLEARLPESRDPLAPDWQRLHRDQWNEAREAQEERWRDVERDARRDEHVSAAAQSGRPKIPDEPVVTVIKEQGDLSDEALIVRERSDGKASATAAVTCAVYSPPQWEGGVTEMVQVWIHLKEQTIHVEAEALQTDSVANRLRSQALGTDLSRGDRVSFVLRMNVLCEIEPPIAAVTWPGEPVSVSFAVATSPVKNKTRALGTVEIRVNHSAAPVGVVHFRVEIVPQGARTESVARPLGDTARPTELVFVSYASVDRAEVIRRVQGLKALGIRFFQDIFSLSPGQRWDEEVCRQIDKSDVFLLCWSTAARESEWVRKEYLHAQKTSAESASNSPHIAILPLEGPPPPVPPPELMHLHFSDSLLYALKVEGELAAEKGRSDLLK